MYDKVLEHIATIECEINILLNRIEKLKRDLQGEAEKEICIEEPHQQ